MMTSQERKALHRAERERDEALAQANGLLVENQRLRLSVEQADNLIKQLEQMSPRARVGVLLVDLIEMAIRGAAR